MRDHPEIQWWRKEFVHDHSEQKIEFFCFNFKTGPTACHFDVDWQKLTLLTICNQQKIRHCLKQYYVHILFARDPEVKWWIAHTAHILKLCSRPSEVLAKIFRAITWCYLLIQIAVKSALDCPDLAKYSNTFSFHLVTRVPKSNKQIWRPYQHGVYQLAEWMQEEQFLHILFTSDREVKLWRGRLTMIAWRVPWSPARQHRASKNIGLAWLDVSLSVLFCAPTILFSKGCTHRQLGKMHQTKPRQHSWEGKMCTEGKLIPSFELRA